MSSAKRRERRSEFELLALMPLLVLGGCATTDIDFTSVDGLPEERVELVQIVEGAAIGAAVGGLAGAVWSDNNGDGYADGYVQNGTYYPGTPQGYDPTLRRVATGALGGAAIGAVGGALIGGLSPIEGAVIGAAVGGLAGAIWADNDRDGRADGYVYNGQYYQGTPSGYAPTTLPVPTYPGGNPYASVSRRRPECDGLPSLSLNPPQPSAAPLTLDNRIFRREGASLRYVAGRLVMALRRAGYEEQGFYCIPGGFALATAVERIKPDSKEPFPGDARWNLERIPLMRLEDGFSLPVLLAAFRNADAGSYRMIVFYVTDRPLATTAGSPVSNFRNLPHGGPDELPSLWRNASYTEQHRVRVVLYEFKRQSVAAQPAFVTPTLPAALQLRRAGILEGLRK